ncbi:hypothetical protein AB6735_06760 [Mucilaginibacter sp. RCC_168]
MKKLNLLLVIILGTTLVMPSCKKITAITILWVMLLLYFGGCSPTPSF